MSLFKPDDFAGRPYEGGLNQGMHVVAGAALVSFLPFWMALALIVAFEVWQYKTKGATYRDMLNDTAYWVTGAGAWAYVVWQGMITGFPVYVPALPLVAFVIEYARIKRGMNGKT